jgi:peptidoglycan hydrolase CwlO-like protein
MKTPTQTLAAALRQLVNDIESPDGVANAAIAEAAERLDELMAQVADLRRQNKELADYAKALSKPIFKGGAAININGGVA